MGKIYDQKHLSSQPALRPLLAFSLLVSMAAFGCTTNLNPGNGTPTRVGPELRGAPTSGVTSGSETAPVPAPPPPPMTSSYSRAQVLPGIHARPGIRRSAAEAAAIMAGRQNTRGRYLGPANPGPGRAYASDSISNFINPAYVTNPQVSINSSITSPPTSGIDNGALTASVATTTGATTGAATIAGTASTTTAATSTLPPGTFGTTRATVTESSGNNAGVTAASAGSSVRLLRGMAGATITNASGSTSSGNQ